MLLSSLLFFCLCNPPMRRWIKTKQCSLHVCTIIHIQTYFSKKDLRYPTINSNSANIFYFYGMSEFCNWFIVCTVYCIEWLWQWLYLGMACLFCVSVLSNDKFCIQWVPSLVWNWWTHNKLLLSSSLSPLRRVFTHISLTQTLSLSNTMSQPFCRYCLWCPYH
jgi:hypothetical protein